MTSLAKYKKIDTKNPNEIKAKINPKTYSHVSYLVYNHAVTQPFIFL